jgi:hypothetical protein
LSSSARGISSASLGNESASGESTGSHAQLLQRSLALQVPTKREWAPSNLNATKKSRPYECGGEAHTPVKGRQALNDIVHERDITPNFYKAMRSIQSSDIA